MSKEKKILNPEITLTNVEGHFLSIFQPKDWDDGKEPTYQMKISIKKDDKKNLATIKQALGNAYQVFALKYPNTKPKKKNILLDGDSEDNNVEEFKGHWYINAKSKKSQPPKIVDRARQEILDDSNVCSGDTFNVRLYIHPYNQGGGSGFSAILKAVQWVAEGENRFEKSSTKIEDAFEILDEPATVENFDGDIDFN